MTPGQLLAKAEHAILTGQPNLAKIYMTRAEEILDQRVTEHLMWKFGWTMDRVQQAMLALPRFMAEAGRAISAFGKAITDAFEQTEEQA